MVEEYRELALFNLVPRGHEFSRRGADETADS